MPKYKGKKRGRKPKEKKRKMNPDRPKRKHTGYTLFMQEIYPIAKSEYPNLSSKDLISMVAKRWNDLDLEAKAAWKDRAQQQDEARQQNIPNNREEYSYLPPKDTDTMDHPERQGKQKDDQVAETGAVLNSHLEENNEEVDNEGIPNDLTET